MENKLEKTMRKRILPFALAMSMTMSLLPTIAYADTDTGTISTVTSSFLKVEEAGTPTKYDSDLSSNPYSSNENSFMLSTKNELLVYNAPWGNSQVYENYAYTSGADVLSNMTQMTSVPAGTIKQYDYVQGVAGNFLGDTKNSREKYVAYVGLDFSENEKYATPVVWVEDASTGEVVADPDYPDRFLIKELTQLKLDYSDLEYHESLGLIDIEAGDFDGDGVDTIVVYVAGGDIAVTELEVSRQYLPEYDEFISWSLSIQQEIETSYVHAYGAADTTTNKNNAIAGDMSVGDFDDDGKDEVVLVASTTNKADSRSDSVLHYGAYASIWKLDSVNPNRVYWGQLADKDQNADGEYGYNILYAPGVDSGDLTGDGSTSIVIAGLLNQAYEEDNYTGTTMSSSIYDYDGMHDDPLDGVWATTVIAYNGSEYERTEIGTSTAKNTFSQDGIYEDDDMYPKTPVACVAFMGRNAAEYVFLSGSVYEVTGGTIWTLKDTSWYFTQDNGSDVTNSQINNVAVGNFDGNDAGIEQIIYTAGRKESGSSDDYDVRMGLTRCDYNSNTETYVFTSTSMSESTYYVDNQGTDPGNYFAYLPIAVDIDNDGVEARISEKGWLYSDPEVKAVLQAAPYFEELGDYSDNVGETTYSMVTGYEFSVSESNSVSVGLGLSIEAGGEGVKTAIEVGGNFDYTGSFEETWATEYSTTFAAQAYDTVAVKRTLLYTYTYDIKNPDTGNWDDNAYTITVPQDPTYIQLSIDEYNAMVTYYNQQLTSAGKTEGDEGVIFLKQITSDMLPEDNEGNPFAYHSAILPDGYKFLSGDTIALGTGAGATTLDWSESYSESDSDEYATGFSVSWTMLFGGSLFGCAEGWAGFYINMDYSHSWGFTDTVSSGTGSSATVANLDGVGLIASGVPEDVVGSYGFLWTFMTWPNDLGMGYDTPFFGYYLTNVTSPPPSPTNLKINNVGEDYATLTWDATDSSDDHPYNEFIIWLIDDEGNYIDLDTVDEIEYWIYDEGQYIENPDAYINNGVRQIQLRGLTSNTDYTFAVSTKYTEVGTGDVYASLYSNSDDCTTLPKYYLFTLTTSPANTATAVVKYNANQYAKSGDSYAEDVEFTISATANSGYVITGLEIYEDGEAMVEVDSLPATNVTFNVISTGDTEYRILTAVSGGYVTYGVNGSGSVGAAVNGSNLNSGEYTRGEVVFTAVADSGNYLAGWTVSPEGMDSYNVSASGSTLTLTPVANTYVEARFAERDASSTHTITVETGWRCPVLVIDEWGETLSLDADGKVEVANGTQVTFTAMPADGFDFDYWSGDLLTSAGATNPYTTVVTSDLYVVANYSAPLTRALSYSVYNALTDGIDTTVGSLSVTQYGENITSGEELLPTDENIVFVAMPEDGYAFHKWVVNDVDSEEDSAVLTIPEMDQVYTIKAYFVLLPNITTESLPNGEVDEAYDETLQETKPDSSYTWKIISGELPDGLNWNEETGTISGTPTTAEKTELVVELSSDTWGYSVQKQYSLTVEEEFVAVTNVAYTGSTSVEYVEDIVMAGYVEPDDATVQEIVWSFDENTSKAKATVVGGGTNKEDYIQEFDVSVDPPAEEYIPITNISGIPDTISVERMGESYYISGVNFNSDAVIEPSNATVQPGTFYWSDSGVCDITWDSDGIFSDRYLIQAYGSAAITIAVADVVTTTQIATVVVTIPDGIAKGEDYVQTFVITGTTIAEDETTTWTSEVDTLTDTVAPETELQLPKGTKTYTTDPTAELTAISELLEEVVIDDDSEEVEEAPEEPDDSEEVVETPEEPDDSEEVVETPEEPDDSEEVVEEPEEPDDSEEVVETPDESEEVVETPEEPDDSEEKAEIQAEATSENVETIERAADEDTEEVYVLWEIMDDGGTYATLEMKTDGYYYLSALRGGVVELQATIHQGEYDGDTSSDIVETYYVTVSGSANGLTAIDVSGGTWNLGFHPSTLDYVVTVPATQKVATVTATGVGSITIDVTGIDPATEDASVTIEDIPLADGDTVVTITDEEGISYNVTINRPVIRVASVYLGEGTFINLNSFPIQIADLLPSVTPENATYQDIIWVVSGAEETGALLSEDGTEISATTTGTFTLTAVIYDGKADGEAYTKDFTMTVYASTVQFVETPVASPSGGTYGESPVVTLTADAGTIYYTLDGTMPTEASLVYTTPIATAQGTYIRAIAVDGAVSSSDMQERYYVAGDADIIITASAGTGGSISPSGSVVVANGGSQEFAITADSDYRIGSVLVDGEDVGDVDSYEFTDVTVNRSIEVVFIKQYTIVASAGAGGEITPNGTKIFDETDMQTYTIVAESGYEISDVLVDEESVGAVSSYTFMNIDENHTIEAKFAEAITNEGSSSSGGGGGGGGSSTPTYDVSIYAVAGSVLLEDTEYKEGKTVAFTVEPNKSYRLSDLTIVWDEEDESEREVVAFDYDAESGEYTFTMPASDVLIVATFEVADVFPFVDVDITDDNYAGIVYVYENGIMAGTSYDEFGGEFSITRGMITAILYRLYGSNPADESVAMTFTDVAADAYYYEAIRWAQEVGVVAGYDADTFAPEQTITNEQFAALLYRYATFVGMDTGVSAGINLSGYADVDEITEYAHMAMRWAVDKGIVGTSGEYLYPTKEANRGEVATALMNFMKM